MGVMLAPEPAKREQALKFFQPALYQARKAGENLYEMNCLINMALLHEGASEYDQARKYLADASKLDPLNEKIAAKVSALDELKLAPVFVEEPKMKTK